MRLDPSTAAPRGLVARPALVERLARTRAPVAVLRAPAGFGKTTLLAAWGRADPRPFAWLPPASEHDDPERLRAAIDAVLARDAAAGRGLDRGPVVVVLDDADAVRTTAARALLAALDGGIGPGSTVVVATRAEPPLPLARLRAQGAVLELGPTDLAMDGREAAELLRRAGAALDDAAVRTLLRRTEGWPAGLRLAALAVRGQPDPAAGAARFRGDDRLVADYLRDEVLAELPPGAAAFLRDASVLDELSGPTCDAVLARRGSGALLRDLERAGAPIAALDRSEQRFRPHPLLTDMLRAELRRADPDHERALHARASAWHAAQGDAERAIDHAIAAGDADRAAALLWGLLAPDPAGAPIAAVRRWMRRLGEPRIAARPALALAAALERLAAGDRDAAEHWAAIAQRRLDAAGGTGEPAHRAGAALVRASIARDGLRAMGADARAALALAPPDDGLHAFACLLRGVAVHLSGGDDAAAEALLERGTRGGAAGVPEAGALCRAQLALLALQRGDVEAGVALAERAHAAARAAGPPAALVHAVHALAAALEGRADDARAGVARARRLLAASPAFPSWYEAEAHVVLARALLRLSDASEARALLAVAARAARRTPEAAGLAALIDDAWARADAFAAGAVAGTSTLTRAELRVLRFLPSHLSFPEIAARLHVSVNTVKTQAHAVYRKLDVSSRSEAVSRASAVGLVDGAAPRRSPTSVP